MVAKTQRAIKVRSSRPSAGELPTSPHALDDVEKKGGHLCELPHVIVEAVICNTKKAPRIDSNANSVLKNVHMRRGAMGTVYMTVFQKISKQYSISIGKF